MKIKLSSIREEIKDIDAEYLKMKHQISTERKTIKEGNSVQKQRVSFI
jgi:hypothetical protein